MAFRVSLLIGNLAPSMGVSANRNVKILTTFLAPLKLTTTLLLAFHQWSLVLAGESKESLLESHVQGPDGSLLVVPGSLQVLDCLPVGQSVAGCTVAVVVAVQTPQPLHLLHDLHGVLLDEVLVGQDVVLLRAAVELCAGQDVGNGSEPEMIVRVNSKLPEKF